MDFVVCVFPFQATQLESPPPAYRLDRPWKLLSFWGSLNMTLCSTGKKNRFPRPREERMARNNSAGVFRDFLKRGAETPSNSSVISQLRLEAAINRTVWQ